MLRTARRRAVPRPALPRTALATAVVLAATSGLTGTPTLPAAAEDPAPAPAPAADEVVIHSGNVHLIADVEGWFL
ncbi:hypothetical protein [Streptomyces roseoviridis]|uniref:Uncharacterized protein n=1 Tax=Streptomyces roseoviridis TaxID=67361 RepID=A0ABV5QJ15_9ACTN